MDQEEEKIRVMISQNVDSSYEFFNGIGVKQMKYLLYLLPFLIGIYKFPFFHHPSPLVDWVIRGFTVACIAILFYLLIRLKRLKGSKITDIEITEEKIRFRLKKNKKKNSLYYSKVRKG